MQYNIPIVKNSSSSEPAVAAGFSTSVVSALLVSGLALFFKDKLTVEQREWIVAIIMATLPIITSLIIRSKVWSPKSVQTAVTAAAEKSYDLGRKDAIRQGLQRYKEEGFKE